MAARTNVTVYNAEDEKASLGSAALPTVFTSPIRPDLVQFVHTGINKNKRQAYAVAGNAGMQTAAESWGTGRAVSRIPRVPGGGTHRAGQGAFGNMCRGGRMFGITRVWRKWHRRVNQKQRRHAIASAVAASALPALVMARGHSIEEVPELPLVLGGSIDSVSKTAQAVKILARFGADKDVSRCVKSKKVRSGKGKMRNRRYVMRRGPLVIYDEANGVEKAFRNIPGVDLACVDRLNLLQLAPGGHVGRFCIWTKGAFEKLDSIFGTYEKKSETKSGYSLQRQIMGNADLSRLINSSEVQSVVRPAQVGRKKTLRKKNPLKNLGVMVKLNPYALAQRNAQLRLNEANKKKKKSKKEGSTKAVRRAYYESFME